MTIQLTAEAEKLIQKRLQTGAFQNAAEVIHDALASQNSEEEWLAENRAAINDKIAHGIAQLDRGEGVSADDARARLRQRKAECQSDLDGR